MTPAQHRGWSKIVISATVLALAAVAGVWAVTRDGHEIAGRAIGPNASPVRTALLAQAKPRPGCPDAPAPPAVHTGQELLSVLRIVDHCLAFSSEVVPEKDVQRRLAELRADPDVVAADIPTTFVPASPTRQPKPAKQWALTDLHADRVRQLWPAGADVRVAVIDTGIDDRNPDLAGQVTEKVPWSHIYDGPDDFHGTHVAGIIAAKDDGTGVLGLTPQAKLLDVQYWDEHKMIGDLGEKIRWAVDHGADVINMSLSGPSLADTELAALLYAEQSRVVVVAASGNCGKTDHNAQCGARNQVRYPAAYDPTVLSVANYSEDHDRAASSSANASVDVAAPGDHILSTNLMPKHEWGGGSARVDCSYGVARHTRACAASGTSMATPYASAAAALLRARHPDATPAAIREAIVRSARPAPGHIAGEHSDEFGTGLLDPVAAAAYLDKHPDGTISRPPQPADHVAPDTVVAGYLGADHKVVLATASGATIPVPGVGSGQAQPRMAFSRDGAWFAAADGVHLAFVNVQSHRQDSISCTCDGVAFNDKGQLLTADSGTIATYEPATASRLHGTRVRNTSGTGASTFMSMTVEGSAGAVTVIGAQFASAGYGAFGVRADGSTFLIGRGPDPGVDKIVVSDDQRWVAWSIQGVCQRDSQMGIADLSHPGPAAYLLGPTGDGEALQIRLDGDRIVAGWAPMQHSGGTCAEPAWPPATWQVTRPAMGTGDPDEPGTASWSKAADQRTPVRRWASGEALTLDPAKTIGQYALSFGPAPGGGGTITLAETVLDAVAPPGPHQPPPSLPPSSSPPSASAPNQPSGAPPTFDAAVARFETFLHALAASDVGVICEIAGPAIKKAEAEGIGPCPRAYRIVFRMISPAQRQALRTATVDQSKIVTSPGRVDIPADAVKASVTFTSSDLGDYTIEYQHGQWYITG